MNQMFALLASSALSFSLSPEVLYALAEAQGRAEGRQEAERDIVAGAMKLKIYGHMAGLEWGHDTYARRMRQRLGVEVVVVAQCTLTSREKGLWEGYNTRIQEELDRRHGPGALSQVRQEAAEQWRRELALMTALPVVAVGIVFLWVIRRLSGGVVSTK